MRRSIILGSDQLWGGIINVFRVISGWGKGLFLLSDGYTLLLSGWSCFRRMLLKRVKPLGVMDMNLGVKFLGL